MKELKVEFNQFYNVVAMKIIEQDESIRRKGMLIDARSEGGICIKSIVVPELDLDYLFIRGSDKVHDNSVSTHNFKTVEEAENFIIKANKTIKMYNERLKQEVTINPFTRQGDKGERFYTIESDGAVHGLNNMNDGFDEHRYWSLNYFTDEKFAKNLSLKFLLYKKLLKFSYENGWKDEYKNDISYHIYFSPYSSSKKYQIEQSCGKLELMTPYFTTEELAQEAIEEIVKPFIADHPNFTW